MRVFSSSELSSFRRTQDGAMMDTCTILTQSAGATDGYGNPADSYSEGSPLDCGYKPRSSREAQQGNETVLIDAELRLPVATTIKSADKVKLTKRYGETLTTPLIFYVVGQPAKGPSGLVVNLRRVTDA